MTPEEKDKIKNEILKQIDSVKMELERIKSQSIPIVSDRSHGRMGQSDAIQNKSMHKRWVESLEDKLYGLQKNMTKIDSEEYGVCEICKKPIGDERLKALPETKRCVRCASQY